MTASSTLMTRKGQITVPVEIRRALGLLRGDRVSLELDQSGDLAVLRPMRSVAERTFGAARRGGARVDLDAMRSEFEQGWPRDPAPERQAGS